MSDIILIVEDNTDNAILATKILENANYQVKVVENGKDAIAFCQTDVPALILLDISLPDIDGFEVARSVRSRQETKDVPIIAVTAHVLEGIEEEARKAGCDEYLSKPFPPTNLIELIKKHLSAK